MSACIDEVLRGIYAGELSLDYCRIIHSPADDDSTRSPHIFFELVFWIGRIPGRRPTHDVHVKFCSRSHDGHIDDYNDHYDETGAKVYHDAWIGIHLHVPLDHRTLQKVDGEWLLGVKAMSVYASQNLHRPRSGTEPQAEYIYTKTYAQGERNRGPLKDRNARDKVLFGRYLDDHRWYVGGDLSNNDIEDGYASPDLLKNFARSLRNQGLLVEKELKKIWPNLKLVPQVKPGWSIAGKQQRYFNGKRLEPEQLRAFGVLDKNFLPGGKVPLSLYDRGIGRIIR